MSLINQMLRDLEQRRTAEAGPSPLGGLSASGSVTQAVNFSINYTTLAVMVAVVFLAGLAVAYFLGGQQQVDTIKNPLTLSVEKESPVTSKRRVEEVVVKTPLSIATVKTETAVVSVASVVQERNEKHLSAPVMLKAKVSNVEKVKVDVIEEPSAPIIITPTVETSAAPVIEETSIDAGENNTKNINKTIRPLTQEQQSQMAFQRAVKLLGRGNQQGAELALEEALTFSQAHLRARETLAALLLNSGRVSEAASSLRDGLQLMPGATPLAKLYARILVGQGDVASAVSVLERAQPAVSSDPEYFALLAALYREEKKHAQAAQAYQQILMQRPGVASWWMGLALSQDAMGENQKALDAFQRAVRAGGLSAEIIKYMRARIVALTPVAPIPAQSSSESDEFGE